MVTMLFPYQYKRATLSEKHWTFLFLITKIEKHKRTSEPQLLAAAVRIYLAWAFRLNQVEQKKKKKLWGRSCLCLLKAVICRHCATLWKGSCSRRLSTHTSWGVLWYGSFTQIKGDTVHTLPVSMETATWDAVSDVKRWHLPASVFLCK